MIVRNHGHILKHHYPESNGLGAVCKHKAWVQTDWITKVDCLHCLKELAKHSRWAKDCFKTEQTKRRIKKTVSLANKMIGIKNNMIKRIRVFP